MVVTIAVVYIFANAQASRYEPMARRFSQTYCENPPGETDHELYVVVNGGGKITERQERLFDPLVPKFLHHDNSAKDLGAYRMFARTMPCDLMVCIGGPLRMRAAGWLDVICRAYEDNGPGLYGNWCFHSPAIHVRTTFFWLPPALLNAYPHPVHDGTRYEFEHGVNSITRWCFQKGFPVLQVTLTGVYSVEKWHHVEPKNCLALDQHFEGIGI